MTARRSVQRGQASWGVEMWHRIGIVLAVLPLAAMVAIDSTSRTCGAVVIEWTPFANEEPDPAPAVT